MFLICTGTGDRRPTAGTRRYSTSGVRSRPRTSPHVVARVPTGVEVPAGDPAFGLEPGALLKVVHLVPDAKQYTLTVDPRGTTSRTWQVSTCVHSRRLTSSKVWKSPMSAG